MIKFEYNMLVLNNAFSNEDVQEINAFSEYVRSQERDRIIALLEAINIYPTGWNYDDPIESVIALIKGEEQ
jgi:hypothetical protein